MSTVTVFRLFAALFCLFVSLNGAAKSDVYGDEGPNAVDVAIERSIVYKKIKDGRDLLADLYLPKLKTRHPTLLMIHGGAWFAGNKAHVAYHAEYAARRGYAVMAINYCLAPKYKFPAQLEDCRTALLWIQEHADEYQFDVDRLGVYGYSAGAHLACLTALSQNEEDASQDKPQRSAQSPAVPERGTVPTIRVVVAGGAPCEFSWISDDSEALAYWLGGSRRDRPQVYLAASPIEFADSGDPPVFLFHGTSDRVVPRLSPSKMKKKLDALMISNELYLLPKGSHFGTFMDKGARSKAVDFLDRHLKAAIGAKAGSNVGPKAAAVKNSKPAIVVESP